MSLNISISLSMLNVYKHWETKMEPPFFPKNPGKNGNKILHNKKINLII